MCESSLCCLVVLYIPCVVYSSEKVSTLYSVWFLWCVGSELRDKVFVVRSRTDYSCDMRQLLPALATTLADLCLYLYPRDSHATTTPEADQHDIFTQ